MTTDKQPPLACNLDAASFQQRSRRFAALNREFLLASRREQLGLELTYSLGASTELRDLVRLEQECCPFLHFELEPAETCIKLSIMAPEHARDSVDALLEPFRIT